MLVVFRGEGLSPLLADTDPQKVGVPPAAPLANLPVADHTAEVVAEFDRQARAILADHPKANVVLLRGFDSHRELPSMYERYGVRSAAIAVYPMYRGVGGLVGMDVLPRPANLDEQLALLRKYWDDYDYFFFHHKSPDSAGEDGNFEAKVAAIEALDAAIPEIAAMGPDVLVVTGDHSTPSQMAAHSWHPVPVLMWGPRWAATTRPASASAGASRAPSAAARATAHAPGPRRRRPPGQVRRLAPDDTPRRAAAQRWIEVAVEVRRTAEALQVDRHPLVAGGLHRRHHLLPARDGRGQVVELDLQAGDLAVVADPDLAEAEAVEGGLGPAHPVEAPRVTGVP